MLRGKVGLLAAAAAAYGVYRFSKMSPEQKNDLKTRGKSFVDKNLGGLSNLFHKKTAGTATNGNGF
jgi:hypothetical protein